MSANFWGPVRFHCYFFLNGLSPLWQLQWPGQKFSKSTRPCWGRAASFHSTTTGKWVCSNLSFHCFNQIKFFTQNVRSQTRERCVQGAKGGQWHFRNPTAPTWGTQVFGYHQATSNLTFQTPIYLCLSWVTQSFKCFFFLFSFPFIALKPLLLCSFYVSNVTFLNKYFRLKICIFIL